MSEELKAAIDRVRKIADTPTYIGDPEPVYSYADLLIVLDAAQEALAKREAVADVRVTTTVDAIDAHSHQFVCDLATAVGALRGRIESWPHDGCGHVEVLWDGPNVSALAVTLRDMLNRTKCVMVNLAPLLAASQQAAKPAPVPEENVMVWLAGDPEAGPAQ